MKTTAEMNRTTHRPLGSRLLTAAAFTLALSLGSGYVQADTAGQTALTTLLQTYAQQEGNTKFATVTILTASADDLTRAVYDILANGPNPTGLTASQLASSALEAVGGKVRKDFAKIAPRIANAAIVAGDTGDTTTVTDVLQSVLNVNNAAGNTKLLLPSTAQQAVTAAALTAATGPGAGAAIGDTALVGVSSSNSAIEAFIEGTLKTIASNGNLSDFVAKGLSKIVGVLTPTQAAIDIAVKDVKNPVAVNAAIAGAVEVVAIPTGAQSRR